MQKATRKPAVKKSAAPTFLPSIGGKYKLDSYPVTLVGPSRVHSGAFIVEEDDGTLATVDGNQLDLYDEGVEYDRGYEEGYKWAVSLDDELRAEVKYHAETSGKDYAHGYLDGAADVFLGVDFNFERVLEGDEE